MLTIEPGVGHGVGPIFCVCEDMIVLATFRKVDDAEIFVFAKKAREPLLSKDPKENIVMMNKYGQYGNDLYYIYLDGNARDFLVWRAGSGRTIEIFDIQVGSERRVGKGTKLIDALLQNLKGLRLPGEIKPALIYAITRISNTLAQEFYEKLGFHIVGRLHYFYREANDSSEHAVMYGLEV